MSDGREKRGGRPARGVIDTILSSRSAQFRLAGSMIGLLSMVLPWGSVIVRDPPTHATVSITGVWFVELMTSSAVFVSIASILFLASTVAALVNARAVVGQAVALVILYITFPSVLADMAAALAPSLPEGTLSSTIAMGFYLGVFSAVVLLISFIPFKEVNHGVGTGPMGSERLRPEENPYHQWRDRPGGP